MKMPHWPVPSLNKVLKYDLIRMKGLMEVLGNPHLKLPPVIHIAGTNGKGSTVSFIRSIFESAGYKVHAYTSPHMVEFNERIVLSGSNIDDNYLTQQAENVRQIAEKNNIIPTFFEGTTAIAFKCFSEIRADIVIVETGIGGRLDCTNIIPNPLLSVITPISYDHMEILGPTLEIIAGEKAGIIKPGRPCIISLQDDKVMEVLFKYCQIQESPSFAYEYDFGAKILNDNSFLFQTKQLALELPRPTMQGNHQIINAATAIAACLNAQGFKFTRTNFANGLLKASWPGRLQHITSGAIKKILPNTDIWVDGAHNEAGAQMLANWIKDKNIKPDILFGMTKKRDVAKFLEHFKGLANNIYGVIVEAEPSSYPAEKLVELANNAGIKVIPCDDLDEAWHKIATSTSKSNSLIITGSLYLVGDVLRLSQYSLLHSN